MNKKVIIPLIVLLSSAGGLGVYFSQPDGLTPAPVPGQTPSAIIYFTPNSQVDDQMVSAINEAQSSIYAAFYDLDLTNVVEALSDAHGRGVDVKVVTDTDNIDNPEIAELVASGLLLGDEDSDYMHNKFMVVDERLVWTGSMNPTFNGVNKNNNNVVVFTNFTQLAQRYVDEFDELWSGVFGGGAPTSQPEIAVSESFVVEVYFAPEDNVEDQIVEELLSAEENIHFATFTFTSDAIAHNLIQKHEEGVLVEGIYEKSQIGPYSTYDSLLSSGITVIKDENPAFMHNKFFIIDNKTVITGSFNPTRHANEENDENILVIHNEDVAEQYAIEFKEMLTEWYAPSPATPTATSPIENIIIDFVHYDALGNDDENLNDEYVVIRNTGAVSADLTGCILEDEAGHRFTFPSVSLEPDATLTIYTGSGTDTEEELYWGRSKAVWNNSHETVYLYDSDMNLIDQQSW